MLDKRKIGELIMKARREKGLTQEDVAVLTGLSRSYICDVENGRYAPSLETLMRLSLAFNVPVCQFVPENVAN